jgi:hypothetical protein
VRPHPHLRHPPQPKPHNAAKQKALDAGPKLFCPRVTDTLLRSLFKKETWFECVWLTARSLQVATRCCDDLPVIDVGLTTSDTGGWASITSRKHECQWIFPHLDGETDSGWWCPIGCMRLLDDTRRTRVDLCSVTLLFFVVAVGIHVTDIDEMVHDFFETSKEAEKVGLVAPLVSQASTHATTAHPFPLMQEICLNRTETILEQGKGDRSGEAEIEATRRSSLAIDVDGAFGVLEQEESSHAIAALHERCGSIRRYTEHNRTKWSVKCLETLALAILPTQCKVSSITRRKSLKRTKLNQILTGVAVFQNNTMKKMIAVPTSDTRTQPIHWIFFFSLIWSGHAPNIHTTSLSTHISQSYCSIK